MADIQLSSVYRYIKSRFNTEGAGLTRFEEDFLDSVNLATRRINREADLETRISMVSDPNEELDLSDEYLDVLCQCISYYLTDMGQRPARGDEARIPTEADITRLINGIRRDIQAQAQEADTDDTSDFVALGGLGG